MIVFAKIKKKLINTGCRLYTIYIGNTINFILSSEYLVISYVCVSLIYLVYLYGFLNKVFYTRFSKQGFFYEEDFV